jgi:Second Messenger Oligonucleotide or Dinucleotide Synthetase domain
MAAENEQSVNQRFAAAIRKAGLRNEERGLAIQRHTLVRELLQAQDWIVDTFLSGSYSRHTATHPINDVDLFAVILEGVYQDAQAAKQAILQVCQRAQNDLGCSRVSSQEHSVGLAWQAGPTIDIVVAKMQGATPHDGYLITNKTLGGWIATFPEQAKAAATEANERCGGHLIPLIKLLKCWNANQTRNNAQGESKKALKSYHLEVMCYDVNFGQAENDRQRFRALLNHVHETLRDAQLTAPGPGGRRFHAHFEEGGHPWSVVDVQGLLSNAYSSADQAIDVESDGISDLLHRKGLMCKDEQAHTYWEKVLGNLY